MKQDFYSIVIRQVTCKTCLHKEKSLGGVAFFTIEHHPPPKQTAIINVRSMKILCDIIYLCFV